AEPAQRLVVALWSTDPMQVDHAEVVLGRSELACGSAEKPLHCLGGVRLTKLWLQVEQSELSLSMWIAITGCGFEPVFSGLQIGLSSDAVLIGKAQLDLAFTLTLTGARNQVRKFGRANTRKLCLHKEVACGKKKKQHQESFHLSTKNKGRGSGISGTAASEGSV